MKLFTSRMLILTLLAGAYFPGVGENDYEGSFNLTDPSDADYNADGRINY